MSLSGDRYVLGVDVSSGLGDWTTVCVLDKTTGETRFLQTDEQPLYRRNGIIKNLRWLFTRRRYLTAHRN